jgi:transposase-like protein
MRKSRFTEEQIAMGLRQAEAGTPVDEVCRKLGIAEGMFYRWKKKYGSVGVSELLSRRPSEKSGEARTATKAGGKTGTCTKTGFRGRLTQSHAIAVPKNGTRGTFTEPAFQRHQPLNQ